jgi:hypothetical protein
VFSLQDHPLPDGRYTYELTLGPATSAVRRDDATAALATAPAPRIPAWTLPAMATSAWGLRAPWHP